MQRELLKTLVVGVAFGVVGCSADSGTLPVTDTLGGNSNTHPKGGASSGGNNAFSGGSGSGRGGTFSNASGGASSGGAANGGSNASGGTANGGASNGGTTSGGTSNGGTSFGGTTNMNGGSANGGSASGGAPMGGAPMGGAPMGGAPMGGAPMGGAPMGGAPMGGAPMGGAPMGGAPMGGAPMGGAPMGGAPMGGAASGGALGMGGAPMGGAASGGALGMGGAPIATTCTEANKVVSSNGINQHCGYTYEYWKDSGTGSMTLTPSGFSVTWSQINNLLARKGVRPGSANLVATYEANYQPNGNSYLTIYGWTRNPLVEYYIVDSWGSWRPPGASPLGTVQSDGGTYEIYKTQRVNQPSIDGNATFYQYWSVRTAKRTSGTITVANHFNAWAAKGMNMGSFYEVSMTVEGYQSSGSADVKLSIK